MAAHPALSLSLAAAAALALVAGGGALLQGKIAANRAAHEAAQLRAAVAAAGFEGARVGPFAPLQTRLPAARLQGVAAVFAANGKGGEEAVAAVARLRATDGYGGNIELLLALPFGGGEPGMRVLAHKETAGIADFLRDDPRRAFDGVAGASISAAALVEAAKSAAAWLQKCYKQNPPAPVANCE